ncbi:ComF family protein [Candidatus Saccharibacteria bacterium]|nr:ComF family protein [Candidatus Saccharibacteria bacterium]
MPFGRSWVIGAREGELAKVIGDFKWSRLRSAHSPLSDLLDIFLPILPSNTVVVPIPTISHHKRIRGYDHADLVARTFAETRGLSKRNFLKRKDNAIQHKANKAERRKQAEKAFYCNKALDPSVPYLLLDDIITTGYTIKAATRVLKGAGAKEIWVAAIARQPLN